MITDSLIIPVYKNAANIESLINQLSTFFRSRSGNAEVIFVIDGNPEQEFELLQRYLKQVPFSSKLILHSRNFGSFAAMRTGLAAAKGKYIALMAADQQEPMSLISDFFSTLKTGEYEVVVASRKKRSDQWISTIASQLFWSSYRWLVNPEIPVGGVDVFGCTQKFKNELLRLSETNTSLIGQIYWLGFSRKVIYYERQKRVVGRSAWTIAKKINYMMDSIFSFTDLPLRLLLLFGAVGIFTSLTMTVIILWAKNYGEITVPGYASTFLVVTFFGSINMVSLGIVGLYIYRTYENTKHRPGTIVSQVQVFSRRRGG